MSVSSGMYRVDCTGAPGAPAATQAKQLWMSSDGQHWTKLGQAPAEGMATALAGAGAAPSVLATTAGIDFSPDGATWQHATISGGAPAGGFSYVGMTSAEQGVAVPADASQGEVFTTVDGGLTWNPSPISGG
jgi:hypothetical protein